MKNNIKIIITIIICSIFFTGVTGYAVSQFYAKDIRFVSTNSNWNVDNVEDALNDLYLNSNKELALVTSFSEGSKTTKEYTFTKDYDYIIISGSGVNNYNNANAGIEITFNDEVELINEFNKTRLDDGEYYTRLTSNIYKNVKVGDKVSIYLGYGSSAIIYGIES